MVDVDEGVIKIDNVDINAVPLQRLRSKISIIPQDIIMFGGTVRDNLDPTKKYTDSQIWSSLEMAQIKNVVVENLGGLDGEIREGGSNLSSGERQLLCLARVILQDSSITIMDEATSSVDPITEKAFLDVMKNAFKDSTVITIAVSSNCSILRNRFCNILRNRLCNILRNLLCNILRNTLCNILRNTLCNIHDLLMFYAKKKIFIRGFGFAKNYSKIK